jgi:hypothetical protein
MATPQRIAAEDQELVTFAQARKILGGISQAEFAKLIIAGHLEPHPVLTDRINHEQIRKFARVSGTGADLGWRKIPDANTEIGSENQIWGTPSFD